MRKTRVISAALVCGALCGRDRKRGRPAHHTAGVVRAAEPVTAPGPRDGDGEARTSRALRLDLLIAVCALLISSFASAASGWQTRLLSEQTRLLQAQLGAEVWPYVAIGETLNDSTVEIKIENDGLGAGRAAERNRQRRRSAEAIARCCPARRTGLDLNAHVPHGQRLSLGIDGQNPGAVLRPGDSLRVLDLTSTRYAVRFIHALSTPRELSNVLLRDHSRPVLGHRYRTDA